MAWAAPSTEGDTGKASGTRLILVYTGLSFGSSLFVLTRSVVASLAGLSIAQTYFLRMVRCIFRAPMSFFDSTPVGRILNRVCDILSKSFLYCHQIGGLSHKSSLRLLHS